MVSQLDTLLKKTVTFLDNNKIEYLIIGGIAAGILGEPRMTQDVDLILFIQKENLLTFLKSAKATGFIFNQEMALHNAKMRGSFRFVFKGLWLDIIIASTEFEQSALKRKIKTRFVGKNLYLPSPEDLILLKIIPGREKDLLDAKGIVARHKDKLDERYLERWASKLSDEAQDMRIWNNLKNLM